MMYMIKLSHILPRLHVLSALAVMMIAGLCVASSASASRVDNSDQIKLMIIQEALKSKHVSPSLALAVAETESSFRPHVVSNKGAIGVMQIMPATATGVFSVDPQRLYQPRLNIQLGVKFLDDLIIRYDGRIDLALSHYNGGSRVTHTQPPSIIPSTRGYVLKVLNRAQHYQSHWRDMINSSSTTPPQMASLPKVTQQYHHKITTTHYQWNGNYHWQNEIKDIDYWLTRKETKSIYPSIAPKPSYSQHLVKRMKQNRERVGLWISQNF